MEWKFSAAQTETLCLLKASNKDDDDDDEEEEDCACFFLFFLLKSWLSSLYACTSGKDSLSLRLRILGFVGFQSSEKTIRINHAPPLSPLPSPPLFFSLSLLHS